MICSRCQRALRLNEGVKCDECGSMFHAKCVNETVKDYREAGDRVYQWKCALCHASASKQTLENRNTRDNNLLHVINIISEKFELVNKFQLPKLNDEMLQIKCITERIAKQNEDILRKMDEFDNKRKNSEKSRCNCVSSHSYRRRNLNLAPMTNKKTIEEVPILPVSEKTVRYRTRRRSYLLHKMFLLLNRQSTRKSPRRKS